MKCALPGRYGRSIPVESSSIEDSFSEINSFNDVEKFINGNFDDVMDRIEKRKKEIEEMQKYIYFGRGSGKNKLAEDNGYESIKKYLLQKDMEERKSQK